MSGHDLEPLLQHAPWLDRLGRQLARDEAVAADAVHDTLLAASRRPPHHDRNVRGFLATILRNLLRLRARRVRVEFGGRIQIDVQSKDGRFVAGTVKLIDANGKVSAPNLHSPGSGNFAGGELGTASPLVTVQPLATGRYEVVVDLGARGTQRQFVDVRACETASVAIHLP